jgi:hypothetical protein
MDDYISREAVVRYLKGYSEKELNKGGNFGMITSSVLDKAERAVSEMPSADVQPVKQWYSVEENQPDSVGDDVLVVDSYGKYHIAYYLSGSENWMNQDTREPIKDVVKWRYLDGDGE